MFLELMWRYNLISFLGCLALPFPDTKHLHPTPCLISPLVVLQIPLCHHHHLDHPHLNACLPSTQARPFLLFPSSIRVTVILGCTNQKPRQYLWHISLLTPRAGLSPSQPVCFLHFSQISQLSFMSSPTSLSLASVVSLLGDLYSFLPTFSLFSCQSVLHEESSFEITNLMMLFPCMTPALRIKVKLIITVYRAHVGLTSPVCTVQSSYRNQTCPPSPASLPFTVLLSAVLFSFHCLTHLSCPRLLFLKPSLSHQTRSGPQLKLTTSFSLLFLLEL